MNLPVPRTNAKLLLVAAIATALSGCATQPSGYMSGPTALIHQKTEQVESGIHNLFDNSNPCSNNDRNIGIASGVVAGALAAHFLGEKGGVLVAGASIGALVGGLIGRSMDARRCTLYEIAQKNDLKLASAVITPQSLGETTTPGPNTNNAVGLDVQLSNKQDEFQLGTATLNPQASLYLKEIARQYTPQTLESSLSTQASPTERQQIMNRQVLIVGHTDEKDNLQGVDLARLSQDRARSVALVFAQNGVPASNLFYQGAGESLPLTSNTTAEGRAYNNRVQIVDMPDLHTMKSFLQTRAADPKNFASTQPPVIGYSLAGDAVSQPQQSSKPDLAELRIASSKATTKGPSASSSLGELENKAESLELRPMHLVQQKLKQVDTSSDASHKARHEIAVAKVGGGGYPILGFVGQPMNTGYRIDLGASTAHSLFPLISSANAADPVIIGPCWQDHPHVATVVRNLASERELSINNALPGLYGEPWWGQQGNSAVTLLHTYAPSDGGAPVPPTTVEFYAKHTGTTQWHMTAKDDQAPVNVYRGSRFTLYRVFLHKQAQCVDIAVPNATTTSQGYVIYQDVGREYGAPIQFTPRS